MGSKSADEIRGLEYDWLATDAVGNLGFFSTAGGGYAPDGFLLDTDPHDTAIAELVNLSPTTRATRVRPSASGFENIWATLAARGVFAFDSDPNGGPYRLAAAPEVPVPAADLPTIARVATRITFPRLKFGELDMIGEELLRESSGA